jgi:hypothetical protein
MLEWIIGLGIAAYGASKLGLIGGPAAPSGMPATAPVPASQTASGLAPGIAGHVLPSHPPPGGNWWDHWGVSLPQGYSADFLPRQDASGIWRYGNGAPYTFTDCNGMPTGQPGYMSLEHADYLRRNVACDGQTSIAAIPQSQQGGFNGAQLASQALSTGITIAGVAAGGGSEVAAGAAAAGSALLALL